MRIHSAILHYADRHNMSRRIG